MKLSIWRELFKMPQIKPKVAKKKLVKKSQKVSRVPAKVQKVSPKKTKLTKNPVAYFECMSACCQKGIKPKKITQVAQECKHNALTINAKISAQKLKEVKKLGASFNEFKSNLEEFVKKSIK